jgi:MFS family permease
LAIEKEPPAVEVKKSGLFYGYVVLVAVFIIILVGGGVHYSFGIFFKPLVNEFGWSSAATSAAFSIYMVFHALFLVFMGRLNDRFGPRLVITVTSCSLGLGLFLISHISALWQLYLYYGVLVSLGMSGTYFPMVSTVARWFDSKRRGTMCGIAASGAGSGEMIFPLVVSTLIVSYGWRVSYTILAVFAWLIILSAAQFLRRDPSQQPRLPLKEGEIPKAIPAFQSEGFSTLEAMHTFQFWLLLFAFFCVGFCVQAIMVHIVPHLIDLGFAATTGATILTVIGGASIVGRVSTGYIADRAGSRVAFAVCFILISAALGWLLLSGELWKFYLFAAVFGFAYGGTAMVHSPLVADLFGLKSHGSLLGIIGSVLVLGGAVGVILAGYVRDLTGGYQPAFITFGVLSILSFCFGFFLRPIKGALPQNK